MTHAEWSEEHADDNCWVCDLNFGSWKYRSDMVRQDHHIASGIYRKKSKDVPAALMVVCQACHLGNNGLHDRDVWPIARQLALKKLRDPKHYDRVTVNRLRGRVDEAITEAEVDEWVGRMNR